MMWIIHDFGCFIDAHRGENEQRGGLEGCQGPTDVGNAARPSAEGASPVLGRWTDSQRQSRRRPRILVYNSYLYQLGPLKAGQGPLFILRAGESSRWSRAIALSHNQSSSGEMDDRRGGSQIRFEGKGRFLKGRGRKLHWITAASHSWPYVFFN